MARMAEEMLRDIDKDTVDWDANFDETRQEPRVLPSRFPNLLVNGSNGIAVGMATNIPPHNLTEVINACICVLKTRMRRWTTFSAASQARTFPPGVSLWEKAASGRLTPQVVERLSSAPDRI